MVKTIGLILMFLCSSTLGVIQAIKTKQQLSHLKEAIDFVSYLKDQIEYLNTPLNSIYNNYTAKEKPFNELVNTAKTKGLAEALQESKTIRLSKNAKDTLKEMSAGLGKAMKDKQLMNLSYCIQELNKEYIKEKEEAPIKTKLSISLGVYAGLMIIILFL